MMQAWCCELAYLEKVQMQDSQTIHILSFGNLKQKLMWLWQRDIKGLK